MLLKEDNQGSDIDFKAVNDTLLVVYLIRIVSDKTGIGKILFSLSHRVWVWIRKKKFRYRIWIWVRGFHYPLSIG
jgi:hypothetical protein